MHLGFLNLAFGTVPLSAGEWLACVAMASVVLWFSELRKLANRAWERIRPAPAARAVVKATGARPD